ncbi:MULTISPECIES: alkyl sulfatase C-terminal domain-containing protein [Rhodococcus]|uniref:alkyl sulfatase C-terminal domain-containing protein n=1 Tax=Rhodococcus TaxID=1827 RepID=UPI001E32A83F|nr:MULTISPECIES: alkyl sulfatase C-terminal domain-containing protein [Rhodococcus]BDB61039.1 hypothetical protein RDE2_28330 [Rhodococcus sp. RDE2]
MTSGRVESDEAGRTVARAARPRLSFGHGAIGTPTVTAAPDIVGALSIEQLFDALALRVDGPRAWSTTLTIDWNLTDENIVHRTQLRNGLLVHFDTDSSLPAPDTTITLTRSLLVAVLLGGADPTPLVADGSITVDGVDGVLATLVSVLDEPDPDFAIVTP